MSAKQGKKMVFSNKTYDILKWVALVGTNAFSVLIITLGKIWGWSYACLLYTSPSPRDAHESRMPSSA